MLDASFQYFDKVRDHRVSKSEWEEAFKALMNERATLSRTITDQEKYAPTTSRCRVTDLTVASLASYRACS
jgi:hypothetical protein